MLTSVCQTPAAPQRVRIVFHWGDCTSQCFVGGWLEDVCEKMFSLVFTPWWKICLKVPGAGSLWNSWNVFQVLWRLSDRDQTSWLGHICSGRVVFVLLVAVSRASCEGTLIHEAHDLCGIHVHLMFKLLPDIRVPYLLMKLCSFHSQWSFQEKTCHTLRNNNRKEFWVCFRLLGLLFLLIPSLCNSRECSFRCLPGSGEWHWTW